MLRTEGLLVFFFCFSLLLPEQKFAPLPAKVLKAKTLYIDNQSGLAELGDRAFDELRKWGRFRVIASSSEADLVLLLSTKEYVGPATTHGYVGPYGNVYARTEQETERFTHVTIIDAKTSEKLWADSKRWGFRSATRELIKGLRKRVDAQERENSR